MKILAVCGHGLGSSFIMEMNLKKALQKLNIDAEVEHTDLSGVAGSDADVFVMGADIFSSANVPEEKVIIMKNLMSATEYEEKLNTYFNKG